MIYVLDGTASAFARAISLVRKGCDQNALRALGDKCKRTGRLHKMLRVANAVISGEINNEQRRAEIRGLAASAGHAVKRRC